MADEESRGIPSRCTSAVVPFLAAAALMTQASPSLASTGDALASTVPLKREVVEEMLIQRFKNRMKAMSDADLAQLTERLLTEQGPFPTDILLPPPPPQRQASPLLPPFLPSRLPDPNASNSSGTTITTNTKAISIETTAVEEGEEVDNTAELLEALGDIAGAGATSAAADTVSDTITSKLPSVLPSVAAWAGNIPRIFGVSAGIAAAGVPAATVIGRRIANAKKVQQEISKVHGEIQHGTNVEESSELASGTEAESSSGGVPHTSGGGGFNFMSWLFRTSNDAQNISRQTDESSREGATAASRQGAASVPASRPLPDAATAPQQAGQGGIGAPPGAAGSAGQVLWRRKEAGGEVNSVRDAAASANSVGNSLWQQRQGPEGKGERSGSASNGQPDLWRMPLETLRSGAGVVEGFGIEKMMEGAADVPPPQRFEGPQGRAASRVPRVSESALDNAEPLDYASNGTQKM